MSRAPSISGASGPDAGRAGAATGPIPRPEPVAIRHLVGADHVAASDGATIENVEPATGAAWGTLPAGTAADVDRAVDAARKAFPAWSRTSPAERAEVLERIADGIEARLDELAALEATDSGKPYGLARTVDIPRAAVNFRFFAGAIGHGRDEAYVTGGGGGGEVGAPPFEALNVVLRRPRGVAGCISPWNLPLYLFTWKIVPALATGNTVVAKPSEVTPRTAHELGRIALEAGLPPGVLNIVHGLGPAVGRRIVEHPDVPAISFTGGTATGARIAAAAAPHFKKLSLELGGKNPTIVFADADLDEAVDVAVRAAFGNQGQICLCGSRLLVERAVADEVTERVIERAGRIRCGDPLDPRTRFGALVSRDHHAKVTAAIERARTESGTVHGGAVPEPPSERCAGGAFVEPAVVTGLGPDAATNTEEIFGPVVSIQSFENEAEAIALANHVRYGLSASIWTRDLDRAWRVAAAVEAGIAWVNCWMLRDLRTPFGGMKQSGVGREGGDEALKFFTEPTNVCVQVRGAGGG